MRPISSWLHIGSFSPLSTDPPSIYCSIRLEIMKPIVPFVVILISWSSLSVLREHLQSSLIIFVTEKERSHAALLSGYSLKGEWAAFSWLIRCQILRGFFALKWLFLETYSLRSFHSFFCSINVTTCVY